MPFGLYLKTQWIEKEGKKEHLPNRTQKGTSIKQLRVVTNQYYIITLTKNLNPENKSISWTFVLYALNLYCPWCILRVYSGYTLLLFIIYFYYLSKKKHTNVAYLKLRRKISHHEQWKIELGMSRKGMQKRALSRCSFIKGIPWK